MTSIPEALSEMRAVDIHTTLKALQDYVRKLPASPDQLAHDQLITDLLAAHEQQNRLITASHIILQSLVDDDGLDPEQTRIVVKSPTMFSGDMLIDIAQVRMSDMLAEMEHYRDGSED